MPYYVKSVALKAADSYDVVVSKVTDILMPPDQT